LIELDKRFVDEMIVHAREDDPDECCGALLGENDAVVALRRVTNTEHSPYRYNMDPQEFFKVYQEAEEKGWELWGFYHSHTHTQAYPSQTDRNLAAWSESYYLIVSLEDKEKPVVRAFSIVEDEVTEQELVVTGTEDGGAPTAEPSRQVAD
jgi:proteasome lid subunit RPN8/RPN11